MDLLGKVQEKQSMTWTSQIRYEPEVLAELALYFRKSGYHITTKSMLAACALRMLRDVLYDNKLLNERVSGPDEALGVFTRLGFQLPHNRRAQMRIMKSLQVESERYSPDMNVADEAREAERQLRAAGMGGMIPTKTDEELAGEQKAKDIEYLNQQQELGSRPNGKEEA